MMCSIRGVGPLWASVPGQLGEAHLVRFCFRQDIVTVGELCCRLWYRYDVAIAEFSRACGTKRWVIVNTARGASVPCGQAYQGCLGKRIWYAFAFRQDPAAPVQRSGGKDVGLAGRSPAGSRAGVF